MTISPSHGKNGNITLSPSHVENISITLSPVILQIAEKKYEVLTNHGVLSGMLSIVTLADTASKQHVGTDR